jgi:hypothetical protein
MQTPEVAPEPQQAIAVNAPPHPRGMSTSLFPEDVQAAIKTMGFGDEIDVNEMSAALRMLAESKAESKTQNAKMRKVVIALIIVISVGLTTLFGVVLGAAWWVAKATQSMQSQGDRLTNMNGDTLRSAGASLSTPVTTVAAASKLRQLMLMSVHGLPSTHSRVLAAGHDLHPYIELGSHQSRVDEATRRHHERVLAGESHFVIPNEGPGLEGVDLARPSRTPTPTPLPNCLADLTKAGLHPAVQHDDASVITAEPFYSFFGQAAVDFMVQTCQYKREGQATLAWDVSVQWPRAPTVV